MTTNNKKDKINNYYIILMADIIQSRKENQLQLKNDFEKIIKEINTKKRKIILSPLTITLGDEFQAVFGNISDATEVIIAIEERKILTNKGFQLRYVLVEGVIETPINTQIAYGMMGEGLTQARTILNTLKSKNSNYEIMLKDTDRSNALTAAFDVFDGIKSEWKWEKDMIYVSAFITNNNYKTVAEELNKDRAQIWRKQKSLKINQYIAIKSIIKYLSRSV